MGKLFQAEGLVKYYERRAVLNDVSFNVERGEVVGMLGPNGAGKTTAFRICMGLIKSARGQEFFDGHEVTNLPMFRRARLGMNYLAQEPSLFRHMSVEDNLRAILQMQGDKRAQYQRKADQMLVEFGLTHLRHHPAYSLSGGERRRLEIARAICTKPKLILLDEPFTGIDPIAVSEVQELVVGLKYRGIGVLITDHNVLEALRITDRAYILSEGRVVAEGTAREILENPVAREHYLGDRIQAIHIGFGEPDTSPPEHLPESDPG
ncbi:MAG: LPS export ABC transporter ATP-binding protein [Chloroflexi bacterium]|nr:LPS export ABC transporter ATP-binding protein [Planctomycetota bacterium]RLC64894.1 MAG: LPS export ABC transporter ATP-binding protein [Chloroflexota bacterium]